MATTTNYGWTTPDDTALVKDGAAAIRTLGSSVDTTTKNLNPETTLGDLAYRSSTANVKTRLALGTAGQLLAVNSGATAPEWKTIGGSGFVHISTTAFSNVATQDIDSVFTSTYKSYLIVFNDIYAATAADDLLLQFRYSTSTQGGNYYGYSQFINYTGTITTTGQNASTSILMSKESGNSTFKAGGMCYVFGAGVSGTDYIKVVGQFQASGDHGGSTFASFNEFARNFTGFRISSASSNITGNVSVYGLANS
jgi:hypothetical protein